MCPLWWKLGVLNHWTAREVPQMLYFNRIPWDDITGVGVLFSLREVLEEI